MSVKSFPAHVPGRKQPAYSMTERSTAVEEFAPAIVFELFGHGRAYPVRAVFERGLRGISVSMRLHDGEQQRTTRFGVLSPEDAHELAEWLMAEPRRASRRSMPGAQPKDAA